MLAWLANLILKCWKCIRKFAVRGNNDALLWCRDLVQHSCGEFSFAVVQANFVVEDNSQVETGSDAIFVGIYDGHGGVDASRYVRDNLFRHFIGNAQERRTISEESLRDAIAATEEGFLADVARTFSSRPLIASMGSCCLTGVIWKGILHLANLGDSRAVIGSVGESNHIIAEQLTVEHNASREEIRQELMSLHPEDPEIVTFSRGSWRIKGIIQVSRTIGDAYLKRPEFALGPDHPRFHLREPITRPVLTAEPFLLSRTLQPNDRFLIFASDGLWELLTNQEAVDIVSVNQRNGIAKKLIKAAQKVAATKMRVEYKSLQKIRSGARRDYHDDITVIVVFIDHELFENTVTVPELSFVGFIDSAGPSAFQIEQATR
ncbi:probable protein phosphatase 2C 43 [Gastrolobium bilobum]|uniref:probable protein phosphatase 2C 43 n=1 Tax=Gastrolobium bilobum TaxID=150636 RepID=UPI002AB13E95|nr:probable protein phosphatase 2C 43 [Gastrolobium bilobum]